LVGVGLIWLVAATLDQLPPLARFVVVAILWAGFLVGGELAAPRLSPGVLGAMRLLAALALGALIFQAAQSLQVPAYAPSLVGLWAAGALAHGYLLRALMPFLVGVATGALWWVWQPLAADASGLCATLSLCALAVLALALAALHGERSRFGVVWRTVGCGAGLVALFVAAVPYTNADDFGWNPWLVAMLVAAGLAAGAAVATATTTERRLEPLAALVVTALSVLMVLWDTGTDTSNVGLADWAHAAVGVAVYVAVAVGVAVLGTLRENPVLIGLAMVSLVVFTTFQSFSVFAAIIQGAWLFVLLGLIFIGTGWGFDRARREISATLEGAA